MSVSVWTRETALAYINARIVIDEETGCHLWQEHKTKDGYAQLNCQSLWKQFGIKGVHRLVYGLTHDHEFRDRSEQVHHTCDVRACCNPDHLERGTAKQNSAQMMERGRSMRGERNSHSILTERQVQVIRRMVMYGFPTNFIASLFEVNQRSISQIKHGKCWSYLPWPTPVYPSPYDVWCRR